MISRNNLTTLCYLEQNGCYLMLHRTKKEKDINKDKWIGIGGHLEEGESPEECLVREMREETGVTPLSPKLRGIITFVSDRYGTEYMFLYSAEAYQGELSSDCPEGDLQWVEKDRISSLPLWEGDKIFLRLMSENHPFFSLKLSYQGDNLVYAALDGEELRL
ncbi:8-oxo-dGTP diphosphatase [Succinivibrio dextrinosolvens]|uniref:NUDIX hydrolase n=1 Tax=Succinivibrio dextrinosolvens TaxID=83771 RepID=UPI0008EDC0E5|nr:8-oxo-dGTP diphosphatase [Succinivibrio dextrinosolvens]SFS72569.1 8-oxo-dGTP diphosphatase [Succinivibrio dextrinosolvens]